MSENQIIVSVCMITYNHESYISDAIEGVLMQKTTFPFELIIGEDCSTDNTKSICLEYQQKYPEIIKLRLPEKNLGVMPNFIQTLNAGSGKYIAICEGDDYWTDPLKLQKQVQFMEENDKYSFCFHNATIYYEDSNSSEDFNKNRKSRSYTTNDLLINGWFIPTASILLRTTMLPNPFPRWYYDIYNGDYGLELLLSKKANFFYLNEKMCVYRKNAVNSLSLNGPKGTEFLKRKLYLLQKFKESSSNQNLLANYFAILYVRYDLIKVRIYNNFPFVVKIKDRLFHRK